MLVKLKNKNIIHFYFESDLSVYSSYSNEINDINILNFTQILNYSFFEEKKGYTYGVISVVPLEGKNYGRLAITNEYFNDNKSKYNITAGKNAIILYNISKIENKNNKINEEEYNDYDYDKNGKNDIYSNIFVTVSSQEKKLNYFNSDDNKENFDFIVQNNIFNSIYVEKVENNNIIEINIYNSNYTILNIKDNNLSNDEIFPIYLRFNTDDKKFYEFINIYFHEFKNNKNIYYKKYYGDTNIYECNISSIDRNNLSILTRPIANCENKNSIINQLYDLNWTKLITTYSHPNSLFDIYIELNDDNRNIKISEKNKNSFNNFVKYLIENKEYTLDFEINHLIKLDPENNANVMIYSGKNITVYLSPSSPTLELQGNSYKIKSDKSTFVYFYGKIKNNFYQFKIEPEKGKNIEIKKTKYSKYLLDFGFKGYNPMETLNLFNTDFYYPNNMYIFVEDFTDKMKSKIVGNENLYLYIIDGSEENIEINYSPNLNHINNEYTFHVIPKNSEEKTLIINNRNMVKIQFEVNYCNSPHKVELLLQDGNSKKDHLIIFNNEYTARIQKIEKNSFKLKFKSEKDFVFSYSFIDQSDYFVNKDKYRNEKRVEMKNLSIQEIKKKVNYDELSNTITIIFNPNYIGSTTRYFIVIAPKDEKNSYDNFSNPCYITNLVIEKSENVKIVDIFDTGEKGLISVDVNISNLLNINNRLIINIISQELKFEKKLNYYTPRMFYYKKEEAIKIDIKSEIEFDFLNNKSYFSLSYEKLSQQNEMFLLNYKLEQRSPLTIRLIRISTPDLKEELFPIDKLEGYINFLWDQNGTYLLEFEKEKIQNLKNNEDNIKGTFKIYSTEESFELDITKDTLEFNEFNIEREETPSLKFYFDSLDKDYTKKFSIENINLDNINEIVLVKENNEEFKPLNFTYYTFEKSINYSVIINFNKKDENNYTLEKFNITEFSSENIDNISFSETKEFSDANDKFLIIEWNNYTNISITVLKNNPKILISELLEDQVNNLVKELKNLKFRNLENLKISKPKDSNYSLLMIESNETGTKLNFEFIIEKNKEDNDNDNNSIILIIVFSIIGSIILLIIVFLLIRYYKRNNQNDVVQATRTLKEEQLLNEI